MATYDKITDLPAASALDGTELAEVAQSGTSKKATTAQIMMPAGMILSFGNTTAPDGYLACDGSAVSRTTYSALFAAIAEVWGVGDGSTTFNVPDMRGAIARGTGSHGSETMADGNPFAGPAVGAFEDDQMQGHKHELGVNTGLAATGAATAAHNYPLGANGLFTSAPTDDGSNGTPRTGDETRSFAAGVLVCIKT